MAPPSSFVVDSLYICHSSFQRTCVPLLSLQGLMVVPCGRLQNHFRLCINQSETYPRKIPSWNQKSYLISFNLKDNACHSSRQSITSHCAWAIWGWSVVFIPSNPIASFLFGWHSSVSSSWVISKSGLVSKSCSSKRPSVHTSALEIPSYFETFITLTVAADQKLASSIKRVWIQRQGHLQAQEEYEKSLEFSFSHISQTVNLWNYDIVYPKN